MKRLLKARVSLAPIFAIGLIALLTWSSVAAGMPTLLADVTLQFKQFQSYVQDGTSATGSSSNYFQLAAGKGSDNLWHVLSTDASGNLNVSVGGSGGSALADATTNPTTASFGSLALGFNGTTWDRVRVDSNKAWMVTLATGLNGLDDSVSVRINNLIPGMLTVDADAQSNTFNGPQAHTYQHAWNGSTWDRVRLLASTGALRVGFTDGSVGTGYGMPGTAVNLAVTGASACSASNAFTVANYVWVQSDNSTIHCRFVADNTGTAVTSDPTYQSPGLYPVYITDTSHDTICCIAGTGTGNIQGTPITEQTQ
jgi:hypothetical protein